jgi:hypothetical protein
VSGYVGKAGIKYPKLFLFNRNHFRHDLSHTVSLSTDPDHRIRTPVKVLDKVPEPFQSRNINNSMWMCRLSFFSTQKKTKQNKKIIWYESYLSFPQHKLKCQYRNSNIYIIALIHQIRYLRSTYRIVSLDDVFVKSDV